MVATVGARLEQDDFQKALIDRLLDRASLVTPNRHEAERLSGLPISSVDSMEAAARAIRRLGAEAVLVKGGHLTGPLVDVFFDGRRMVRLPGRRYRKSLHEAVRRARRKVDAGFRASYRAGHGVEIINSQIIPRT
jgi:hydroxymethylpyrimidine/phosphomethylpyrimidine kinase